MSFFFGQMLYPSDPHKQNGVARSSTEAEYRALASAAAEVCWLKHLFCDLGILSRLPPRLLCDNISATHLFFIQYSTPEWST